MSNNTPQIHKILAFVISGIFLFISIFLSRQGYIFSIALMIMFFTFAVAIFNNKIGLYSLIIIRPCLDFFTDEKIEIGEFSINLASFFSVFALFFAIFVIMKNFKKLKMTPITKSWLLFLFILLTSFLVSININSSLTELTRLTIIFLLFSSSFILIEKNKDLSILIKIIIASAIIPAGVSFYQFFTKTGLTVPFEGVYNRTFGTFSHPNLLAFYLLLVLTLCFVIFLVSDKKRMSVLIYSSLSLFFLVSLAFTYTRSAWIGLLLVILMLGIIKYRIFLIIALVAMFISYFSIEQINTRVKDLGRISPYSSIQWRLDLWEDSLNIFKEKPILGHGVGTSKEIILRNRGPQAGSPDAHNDYLRVALEAGILGLIAYIILIFNSTLKLFKLYLKQKKPKLKTLNFVVLILSISIFLISFGDNIINNTALEWSFWILVGGLLSIQKNLK